MESFDNSETSRDPAIIETGNEEVLREVDAMLLKEEGEKVRGNENLQETCIQFLDYCRIWY